MTIRWTGPFNDAGLPAGQRIAGWSEHTSAADTLKARYRDGDPASAFIWREMWGNQNFQYATSARTVWVDEFVEKTYGAVDPTKCNTSNLYAMAAVYAVTPPLILLPNALRGDVTPPRLRVKVRARRSAGAGSCIVRVYASRSNAQGLSAFPDYAQAAPVSEYVSWTLASNTYPADPGWSSELIITRPGVEYEDLTFPAAAVLGDVRVMQTTLVLAGWGDGAGNGPFVAAIQVREEAPGG